MPGPRRPQLREAKLRRTVDVPHDSDNDWYTIKTILDERVVRGRVEYLVDWDHNRTTGETYSPTWSREVTDAARDEWEQKKEARATEATENRTQDSPDSQSPRPSNRRKRQRPQAAAPSGASRRRRSPTDDTDDTDDVDAHRPTKVARVSRGATPSEEPVPSIVSISSPASLDELDGLDPLAHSTFDARLSQQLVVELQAKSDFDPSEYASQHNTQSSGQSSQSVAELEERDERSLLASQLTRQTIPDSQEPSGQTWTQEQPAIDFEPSSQGSQGGISQHQTQSQIQPETCSQLAYPAGELSSPPRRWAGSIFKEEEKSCSDRSNANADIPSHQPGRGEVRSLIASQDFALTIPATEPPSVQSPQGNQDLAAASASSPVFLSQVAVAQFKLYANSVSSQESPSEDTKKNSKSTEVLNADFPAELWGESHGESQDAQVWQINPFVSHVRAFSVSHDAANSSPSSSLKVSPVELKPEYESLFALAMENQNANEPANPTPRPSAVDELSQILNFNTVVGDGSPHPREGPPSEHAAERAASFEMPATNLSIQDRHQQPSPAEHASPGPQSEQLEFDITPLVSQVSAVTSMKSIVDKILANTDLSAFGTMMPDVSHKSQPELSTISLADISKQPDLAAPLPLMPSLLSHDNLPSNTVGSSGVSVSMGQPQQEHESNEESSDESPEPITLKHIITLPFQARLRPLYDKILLDSKSDVTQFGAIFNSEDCAEPDEALVQKIDQVFSQLHSICDYPPDAVGGALEDLPSEQLIKYCYDANSKFNFIYELLQGIQKETHVLIVASSTDLLRLLYRLTEVLEIECVCVDIGKFKSRFTSSLARVTLILPGRNVEGDDFDVVIGYDHSYGGSEIAKKLEPEIPEARSPMVLMLVTTHSIEHIDLYIPDDLTLLERKNALMSGIVRSRHLVSDPDRGYPEPHQIAGLFLDYLNGQVEGIIWEPLPVPEEVMDIYLNSQSRSQMPVEGTPEVENARKRKLDESDDEDVKRMRILSHRQSTVQTNEAPVPDDVKTLLDSANIESTPLKASHAHISVPICVLQALAEQKNELQRQVEVADRDAEYKSLISGLEVSIKEYQRTNAKMYSSQRQAVEDRAKFERDALKAESNLVQANETGRRDAEKAQEKIADLEAIVVRLTADPSNPDEPSPLSKTQSYLQESLDRIAMLEKRLENAHKDADYARRLYQEATTASSVLRGENADLVEQVADLSKKTAETLGKVHQIQADATIKTYLHQIRDLRAQLRERELELDLAREELRTLRNGRRETRHVSVPRSPRMGMMSPRTGRATYGSAGGSTSRGTSPAPTSTEGGVLAGMQFLGQPPNGRWQHLRG
ncbi:Chromo domain-like protein [Metarhizium album ARSEF 1941]|uniref:Chromo domain-like protein n=1 Tax=Metarhizium album (strain ARSEF 1941) TaxID=1081103 RepID=A0A0B2X897_METAS|nr:Chromo domain-like protein [Metarhizium album ARSEF 1941]KHO01531.1 Chromo domain-like protein [Metarhizium album ARSEF 1941]